MRGALAVILMLTAVPAFTATAKRLDAPTQPIVVRPAERTVTIDFKDAEAKVVLKEMQKQCGIRNLVIDPGVAAKTTVLFTNVPCRQAFGVVLRSMGLDAKIYSNNMVNVGAQKP